MRTVLGLPGPGRKSDQLKSKARSLITNPPARTASFAMVAVGVGPAEPGLAFYAMRVAGYHEGFPAEGI